MPYMSQSLVQIPIQLVFSTHHRLPLLADVSQRNELHRYMHGICRSLGSPATRINGPADHVHVLCALGKQRCVSDLVRDLKSCSSRWFSDRFPQAADFHWQKGYGAFAVSPSAVSEVVRYIEKQEEHHRVFSYKDEFRKLCVDAGVVIDERYVWE
ncbi:MAG TPA: transposase [Oceanipulchritudo sp.]|nr:transposase [Oceanipulchritudo sp.]